MKKIDVLNLDYKDIKNLKRLGYNLRKYYAGPWGWMSPITKLRDFLEKFGIKFPFNTILFIHDISYNQGGSIVHKMKVDFKFLLNMLDMIFSRKDLIVIRNRLIARALFYYVTVVLATPIYVKQGNWRLSKN